MSWLYNPWPWFVVGPLIALVMLLLLYFNESFGISSNFRTMCSMMGAGKVSKFFQFDWKSKIWNLVFLGGAVVGGFISNQFLQLNSEIILNPNTIQKLEEIGITNAGKSFLPELIFGSTALESIQGWIFLLVGGLLVGFGTRYAGGCTSGHAISGLSNFQKPSLIAVIGFFIGGLLMTHYLLPFIL